MVYGCLCISSHVCVVHVFIDITWFDPWKDVIFQTLEKFGGIDILVSNAAVNPTVGGVLDVSMFLRYLCCTTCNRRFIYLIEIDELIMNISDNVHLKGLILEMYCKRHVVTEKLKMIKKNFLKNGSLWMNYSRRSCLHHCAFKFGYYIHLITDQLHIFALQYLLYPQLQDFFPTHIWQH